MCIYVLEEHFFSILIKIEKEFNGEKSLLKQMIYSKKKLCTQHKNIVSLKRMSIWKVGLGAYLLRVDKYIFNESITCILLNESHHLFN